MNGRAYLSAMGWTAAVSLGLGMMVFASAGLAADITPGNMIFPNYGLNAIQEFDPRTRTVVQTLPLPAPYSYSGAIMLHSALVRVANQDVLLNVRGPGGKPCVLALSRSGQFVAATGSGGSFLQQIAFDPLDPTQMTVLGGTPFGSNICAVDPYARTSTTRAHRPDAGNFIGLHVTGAGDILTGDFSTGEVVQYSADGTLSGVFANIGTMTGSNAINGITIDTAGYVYVCQGRSQHIVKLDSNGGFIELLTASSFDHPTHIFHSPLDDRLYVGNNGNGLLTIMQTNGSVEAVVDLGGRGIGTAALVPKGGTSHPEDHPAEWTQTVRITGCVTSFLGGELTPALGALVEVIHVESGRVIASAEAVTNNLPGAIDRTTFADACYVIACALPEGRFTLRATYLAGCTGEAPNALLSSRAHPWPVGHEAVVPISIKEPCSAFDALRSPDPRRHTDLQGTGGLQDDWSGGPLLCPAVATAFLTLCVAGLLCDPRGRTIRSRVRMSVAGRPSGAVRIRANPRVPARPTPVARDVASSNRSEKP